MKRFLLSIIVFALAFVCFVCPNVGTAHAEANDIKIELDSDYSGDELVVSAVVTSNDGVISLFMRVEYDESQLELVDRTYGNALSDLEPVDNFEGAETFSYPYRVIYAGTGTNVTDTGVLFTLRFKQKKTAVNGKHDVKLVVREVGYKVGNATSAVNYNPKYGAQLGDPEEGLTGGVVVSEETYLVTDAAPAPEAEGSARTALVIGLAVGGGVVLVGIFVAVYFLYKKKQTNPKTEK